MGNRQFFRAGKHLEIASRSSFTSFAPEELKSVQKTLNFAILTDPHNEFDCNDEGIDDETKIMAIVDFMRDRGFRPVTAHEFLTERRALLENQGVGDNITIWRPLVRKSGDAGSGNNSPSLVNKRGESEKKSKVKKSRAGKDNKSNKSPR